MSLADRMELAVHDVSSTVRLHGVGGRAAEDIARAAVRAVVRILPSRPSSDPLETGGAIVGGSHDEWASSLIDASRAVLLDNATSCMIEGAAVGRDGTQPIDSIALELAGRINGDTARANTVYLTDIDGAARLIANLVGLVQRAGRTNEFEGALAEALQAEPTEPVDRGAHGVSS